MFDNFFSLYIVVSVCKFDKKNVNKKNEFMLVFNQKFKNFTNKKKFQLIFFIFFFKKFFFQLIFFFNEFLFQLILTKGVIGNGTLNLREGIVISKNQIINSLKFFDKSFLTLVTYLIIC